jgi:hypothetical protein
MSGRVVLVFGWRHRRHDHNSVDAFSIHPTHFEAEPRGFEAVAGRPEYDRFPS